MISHLAAICRFSFPNRNFFPVLSLGGWPGASIGICLYVIFKNYFQYFCPVLSTLVYFTVFPADGEECLIFLTFSTFPKNADFFFFLRAIMKQDTTGIICFKRGFIHGCTSWWDLLDATVPLALCCFDYGIKAEAWFVEWIFSKEVLQVFSPASYRSVFMLTVADSYKWEEKQLLQIRGRAK